MHDSIEAALSGNIIISTNKAADVYGVPKPTLKDRLSSHVVHGVMPGPRPCLGECEKMELAENLKDFTEIGLGKTRGLVLQLPKILLNIKEF